ncbi:CotS family spore coat protein [Clostridium algidicarnis]|uniref:CotS family spore coat protein n=1 Tax=Clostridium algidicarnis TaxID=37659 RepID=UPI003395B608
MVLEEEYIKLKIKEEYGINVVYIKKIKNVYKLKDERGMFYALKIIKYEFPHFLFIMSAINHLYKNGFLSVVPFINTKEGSKYISLKDNYAYLNPWIIGRESNYDNPIELSLVTKKLAQLHEKSQGFTVDNKMKPRIYWFKWFEIFESRINEILGFKKIIEGKENQSYFDSKYLSILQEEVEIAKQSIYYLGKSNYVEKMTKEIDKHGFCHHDIANHNIIINSKDELSIIDFDYCILDTHLHDLSSILIRTMKNGRWDLSKALFILDKYNEVYTLEQTDLPIMAAFIEFPQDYWQLGIQYYLEKQPWKEEIFLRKLNKIVEDRELKEDFIKEFRTQRYKGG